MAVCEDFVLCFEMEIDPNDENYVLARETENPEVVVRSPRKNVRAFLDAVKEGKYDDI